MGARSIAAILLGLVAALAASVAIWRFAPPMREDLRLAACLAPLVVWGLIPPIISWFGRKKSQVDNGLLRDQKRAVLGLLKSQGLKRRGSRYRLPLFLVFGPAGAGKSSLLENCGLGLESGVRIGDAIWWVGDDAIFVEATIGAGHENTVRLVSLLRAVRPRLPLNGMLLVVSPADLTLTDGIEYGALTQATTEAIREIETGTHAKYPLYLLLSKIDLVPGFQEFFDRQEPQERTQPWGFVLPFDGLGQPLQRKHGGQAITEGFRRILGGIRARLIEWLAREGDPVRCGRINGFAVQVAALLPTIQPMVDALVPEKTRNWSGAQLRGIFLTSARQEALSIDPILPEMSTRFAMPRSGMVPPDLGIDEENHGFFLQGAFNKAILAEAGLALKQSPRRRGVMLGWVAAGLTVLAAIALGLAVYDIFGREIRWPARAQTLLADSEPAAALSDPDKLPVILNDLKQLSALADELDGATPAPVLVLGLSADTPLKSKVARAREALLRNGLAPHLKAMLETQLVNLDADIPSLKTLIGLVGSPGQTDTPALRQWLEQNSGSIPQALRARFVEDGLEALREAGGIAVSPDYIDAARRILAYKESLS